MSGGDSKGIPRSLPKCGGVLFRACGWHPFVELSINFRAPEMLTGVGFGGQGIFLAFVLNRAATEAVRWGLDDAAVKRIGSWESWRFMVYVCPHLFLE